LPHRVVKTKWSNKTKDAKNNIITGLKNPNGDERLTKQSEKTKAEEKGCKNNRNPDDYQNGFIFSISLVDVVFFDNI
jgi:hypothetical protein